MLQQMPKILLTWAEPTRVKGKGKLIIAMYETKGYAENGIMKEDRQYIAGPEERAVLLT
jgi:hypothetical protein